MDSINRQYNKFSKTFSQKIAESDLNSRQKMWEFVGQNISNKKLLDVGCGDGLDLEHYASLGAVCYGLDASEELVNAAKIRLPGVEITCGLAEKMEYPDDLFDFVVSKYAIMTSFDLEPIFNQLHRVLKPNGLLIYLCTHPFRQYLEKKKADADYFKQEVVQSNIFDGAVSIAEPSHTFNEYFNSGFFSKFDMIDFHESFDDVAEKINDSNYPGFFIVKARRK